MSDSGDKRARASAVITVHKYEPSAYDEPADGPALTRIHVKESFSGDIQGDGVVEFLQAGRADGSASFVGIERVTGTLAGREGTFLLQDAGTVDGSIVSGELVRGSGVGHRPAGRAARRGWVPRQPRRGRPGPPGLLVRMTAAAADRRPWRCRARSCPATSRPSRRCCASWQPRPGHSPATRA